jgi:hypothetical protein
MLSKIGSYPPQSTQPWESEENHHSLKSHIFCVPYAILKIGKDSFQMCDNNPIKEN